MFRDDAAGATITGAEDLNLVRREIEIEYKNTINHKGLYKIFLFS